MENKDVKVVVIGLDGATWNIIRPLIKKDKLPTFKELIENGIHGTLRSTIPPSTIPAWPSFYTGKNPGKYGVYGFFKIDDTGNPRLMSMKDVKSKKMWEYFGFHNIRSIILNMPLTYPPEKIDGIMVSGFPMPENETPVFPKYIKGELETMGYLPDITPQEMLKSSDNYIINKNIEVVNTQKKFFIHLIKKYKWDFAFLLFRAPDTTQHRVYNKLEIVGKVYATIDNAIKEIMDSIGEETLVIIMSDHGFTKLHKVFCIHAWLHKKGMLTFKKSNQKSKRSNSKYIKSVFVSLGITRERIVNFIEKRGLTKYVTKLHPIVPKKLRQIMPYSRLEIDWEKTIVYYPIPSGKALSINLKGREPYGIVSKKGYRKILDELIVELNKIVDIDKNLPIIKKAYKKEELYFGEFLEYAPDIILLMQDGYDIDEEKIDRDIVLGEWKENGGVHHIDGILLAYGPGIKKGYEVKEAHIYDLLPTILHIFGLPIPNDVDGKVLMEIFEEDSEFAKRKPKYVDPSYYEKGKGERERLKGKIRERIRELKVKGEFKI